MTLFEMKHPVELDQRDEMPDQLVTGVVGGNLLEVLHNLQSLAVNVFNEKS
jgi:hypothetical protein